MSTALHLRLKGMDVALIDLKHPGEEASFGNAGVVQANGFAPAPVPRNPAVLLDILLGRTPAVSLSFPHVLHLLPWIRDYQRASSDGRLLHYARTVAPLRAVAAQEHLYLAKLANAERFYRASGWLHVYRAGSVFKSTKAERYFADLYGVDCQELSGRRINELEPGLLSSGLNALFWPDSHSVSDPGGVVDALWRSFVAMGGRFCRGDARKLGRLGNGWTLDVERQTLSASNVVVALGAWSRDLLDRFGETYPMAVKRGYHMHYLPSPGASLARPVVDLENGFVLTPMEKGIRLTTGVELAGRDAPANKKIIELAEERAKRLYPLGLALQDEPWLGSRPCLPDSLPIVGPSPANPGLWHNFGHGHDGFTFGPVTGRLLADVMTGASPAADIASLSAKRFLDVPRR